LSIIERWSTPVFDLDKEQKTSPSLTGLNFSVLVTTEAGTCPRGKSRRVSDGCMKGGRQPQCSFKSGMHRWVKSVQSVHFQESCLRFSIPVYVVQALDAADVTPCQFGNVPQLCLPSAYRPTTRTHRWIYLPSLRTPSR
jgi:hypothetical protein